MTNRTQTGYKDLNGNDILHGDIIERKGDNKPFRELVMEDPRTGKFILVGYEEYNAPEMKRITRTPIDHGDCVKTVVIVGHINDTDQENKLLVSRIFRFLNHPNGINGVGCINDDNNLLSKPE